MRKLLYTYSNTKYQQIARDPYFKKVPFDLCKWWYQYYNDDGLSLDNAYDRLESVIFASEIEELMSDLKTLENQLANQFRQL